MTSSIKKWTGKVMHSFLVFFVFVYVTIFICEIPQNYTFNYVEGQWLPSHNFFDIVQRTHEKLGSLLRLDLGTGGRNAQSLNYLVTDVMLNTLTLLGIGLVIGIIFGVGKGILDSRSDNNRDSSLSVLSTIIPISLPDIFIIAALQRLAIYLNHIGIDIFKVGGSGSINHLLLPVIALSILPSCYIARITSMAIEECNQKDYIRVVVGKGSSRFRVLWNHVMRNAMQSIVSSLPTITSILIGNLMMVEYLFSYPGLTRSLFTFYKGNESDGIIANVLLIGMIYFALNAVFKLMKIIVTPQVKEGSL